MGKGAGPQFQRLEGVGVEIVRGADIKALRWQEAKAAVIARVAIDEDGQVPQRPGLFQAAGDQFPANALPLVGRPHRHRAKGEDGVGFALIPQNLGLAIDDAAKDFALRLGHPVQGGDARRVLAQQVQQKMLITARHKEVPEGLPGELLRGGLIPGGCLAEGGHISLWPLMTRPKVRSSFSAARRHSSMRLRKISK